MFVSVAKRIVSVALIATAVPALADSSTFSSMARSAIFTSGQHANAGSVGYWTSSSDYYLLDQPGLRRISASSRPAFRHVLITGYHPVQGFAAEVVKEAANATR